MTENPDIDKTDQAQERLLQLEGVQQRLGYVFTELNLLEHALTHRSSTAEDNADNERLEFLGDAILDFIICEYLFHNCPQADEGLLTEIKSEVVSRRSLSVAAQNLQLRECIVLGKGIDRKNDLPDSVYANIFEAVVSAVYFDSGIDTARSFVLRVLEESIELAKKAPRKLNCKSSLQEWVQKDKKNSMLVYRVIATTGPEHARSFEVAAYLDGNELGRGRGRSKKEAEQDAARSSLMALGIME